MNRVMKTSFQSLFVCLVSIATPCSIRAEDPPEKGPQELQGVWKLTSVEVEGMAADPTGGQVKLSIKGDKVFYGGEEIATLKVDSLTSPRIIDLKLKDPERVFEGIYAVEKGTLKICLNRLTEGAKDRPAAFSTKDQTDLRLLVFEQEKDAKEVSTEGLPGFAGLILKTDDDSKEVVVVSPLKGSSADKAGFLKDDVILKVAGTAVVDLPTTVNSVRKAKLGDKIEFRIRRGKEERTITVKVGVLPFQYVAGLG